MRPVARLMYVAPFLTLTFEHAQPITVTVKVEAAGVSGTAHDHNTVGGMQGQMGHTP